MSSANHVIELRKVGQKFAYASLSMHEAIARKAGFAGTDHKYLGYFLQKGSLTAGELAALSGLTTGAVTGLIDRFEKKGLVKRMPDEGDRRKVVVIPDTEKITALLRPLYQTFQHESEQLIASFSEQEIRVIDRYLRGAIDLAQKTTGHMESTPGITGTDVLDEGPFYHGTRVDLQIGDLLTAGHRSNYKPEIIMNHIYFTALVDGAGLAASLAAGDGPERVYIVEPTGSFENDPNVTDKKFPGNPTRSYRSQAPLKIVGEVTDWARLRPEDIRAWREKLANIKGEIIN